MLENDILIDRLKAQAESRNAETFRFMEEQKIKKALAPAQWEGLKLALKQDYERLRRVGTIQIGGNFGDDSISMWNVGNGASVSLNYDKTVPCVHYESRDKRGHFGFQVVNGNAVTFVDGNMPIQIQRICLWATQSLLD